MHADLLGSRRRSSGISRTKGPVRSRGSSGRTGPRRLRVVVGVGQHGKVPARLPAAVRRYLQEQGISFSEPYTGLLEVSL